MGYGAGLLLLAGIVFGAATRHSLMPLPTSLETAIRTDAAPARQVLAADDTPLNLSFGDHYNLSARLPLSAMPLLLRQAFIMSEDQHFWEHGGVDWPARLAALWGNFVAGEIRRGASTIAEQVARILVPRPRTYWGHWTAGWDARRLIHRFGHARILKFYLNQVPYAGQRRGAAQAARYYYGRALRSLNPAELLSLAVLIRSPVRYDPRVHPDRLHKAVRQLAGRMHAAGLLAPTQWQSLRQAQIRPGRKPLPVHAAPFVLQVRKQARQLGLDQSVLHTTLRPRLQRFVQQILRHRTAALAEHKVGNAAALVVNNQTGAVLAWAKAPGGSPYGIDPVVTPRQPGSALKPFVYGLAMARLGWQPDHVLSDTPLDELLEGGGLHRYSNYSGKHYGRVSLRYALGNSLNIPAVRTAAAVGVGNIIALFKDLGFTSFGRSDDYYGAGIALGDGAVSLFELVQAYASLARHGRFLPLTLFADGSHPDPVQVLPAPVASVLGDVLSDPGARRAEFGANSILNLLQPTATKTGTSSNYHDTWTVGYDNRYTIGVWMGNLDGSAMNGITGALGPAPIMHQIFAWLRQREPYPGLWHSPRLERIQACEWLGPPPCIQRFEWHLPALDTVIADSDKPQPRAWIVRPVNNETLAIDPRVPRAAQRLQFKLRVNRGDVVRVIWYIDDKPLAGSDAATAEWMLHPGRHKVHADVWLKAMDNDGTPLHSAAVTFMVRGGPPDG